MGRLNGTICIFALALALTGAGVTVIYSTSAPVAGSHIDRRRAQHLERGETFRPVTHHWMYLRKQLMWCGIGLVGLLLCYGTDYNEILKRSRWLLLGTFVLLVLVFLFGPRINGAKRWLRIGPFSIQPSEFAKLALVIATAKMLSDRRQQLRDFARGFFLPMVLAAVFIATIAVEDLGSAVVLGLIMLTMWFIAGVRIIHLLALVPAGLAVVATGVLLKPYRLERITTFVTGGDPSAEGWHTLQSLIAVGTGGWTGLGLGLGIQKHGFVAAMYTDFIFADICEEIGFVGATVLLLMFAALFYAGYRVAVKAPDFIGGLLAAGLTTMIAVPVLINVAVVLGCLPAKGLPLPFLSFGGSSLAVNLCAIGLLMNIARRNEVFQEVRRPVAVTPERRLWRWGRPSNAY